MSATIRIRPLITAILMGGVAGLIAIATYEAMMGLQRLLWETGAPGGAGPARIAITILVGGALLILIGRIAPTETVAELIADSAQPWRSSRRAIAATAIAAIVAVAFGGAIGPEAGLLAVVGQCSAIVSRLIARDEAQASAIAEAGTAGTLGGLYGSPPVAAALEEDAPAPSRALALVAGVSGFFAFLFVSRTVFGGEGVARVPLPAAAPGTDWLIIVPILVGIGFGIAFRALHAAAGRAAARVSPWVATAIGTTVFAALAAAIPLVRFSGHHELTEIPLLFSRGEGAELWLLAAAKVAALVLCLAAGWRGGEIFPLIFIGAAAGAATAVLLPGVDPAAAVAAAMAATVAVGWRKPFAAFLVLILVVDGAPALPLLAGVGIGAAVDRLLPSERTAEV